MSMHENVQLLLWRLLVRLFLPCGKSNCCTVKQRATVIFTEQHFTDKYTRNCCLLPSYIALHHHDSCLLQPIGFLLFFSPLSYLSSYEEYSLHTHVYIFVCVCSPCLYENLSLTLFFSFSLFFNPITLHKTTSDTYICVKFSFIFHSIYNFVFCGAPESIGGGL